MFKKLFITVFIGASLFSFVVFPEKVSAAAEAFKILPFSSNLKEKPAVIYRLSSVTSEDGKRAIIAWETEEPVGVRLTITCSWAARGSGKVIASSRAGWSHRVSCDGKPTRIGTASAHAPTVEIYYSGASYKGLDLTAELTTAGGFMTPFGERVIPKISMELSDTSSIKANTDEKIITPSDNSNATFEELIPEGFQEIIKQSPFYKYLNNTDLSKYGI